MTKGSPEQIAGMLSEAQRAAVLKFDGRVWSRTELHHATRRALFRIGILGDVMAAGHIFFHWTALGLAVREHLQRQA